MNNTKDKLKALNQEHLDGKKKLTKKLKLKFHFKRVILCLRKSWIL